MVKIAADAGHDFGIVREAIACNDAQFERVVSRILGAAGDPPRPVRVAMLGLAFKAGTDDIRSSPALEVARRLCERGAVVVGFDPVAVADVPYVEQVADVYQACADADVVAVLTEWPDFASLDFDRIASLMAGDTIVDTRSVVPRESAAATSLRLMQIGRPDR